MWVWLAAARAADTFDSSALLGMGRVGVASADENAALTLNPGLLALEERYDFQGQFRYGPNGSTLFGGSAMDGRTSDQVSGGLAYTGDVADPALGQDDLPGWVLPGTEVENRKRHHDFALGLGFPLAKRHLSVGVGANLGYFDHDRQGTGWLFDGYVGLGARPVDELTLGLAARNFLPLGGEDRPTTYAAGVRLDPKGLPSAEFDATLVPSVDAALPVDLAAGLEVVVGVLSIRGGWRRDAANDVHSAAAGLGLGNPGASLEYGTLLPLSGTFDLDRTVHQISLRFGAPDPIPEP